MDRLTTGTYRLLKSEQVAKREQCQYLSVHGLDNQPNGVFSLMARLCNEKRPDPRKRIEPFRHWWRRGESNPRPKALRRRYYMLSVVYGFSQLEPDEQENQSASPLLV